MNSVLLACCAFIDLNNNIARGFVNDVCLVCREELGQREEALSSYRHILNAEPKNKTALAKLKERQETLQERS